MVDSDIAIQSALTPEIRNDESAVYILHTGKLYHEKPKKLAKNFCAEDFSMLILSVLNPILIHLANCGKKL